MARLKSPWCRLLREESDHGPREGRVGIVYPWANLDSVPSLTNAALLLAEAGFRVDIFTLRSPEYEDPAFSDSRIDVVAFNSTSLGHRLLLPRMLIFLAPRIWRRHRITPYVCLIGVDPEGLVLAHGVARFAKIPLVYYSLELLLWDELGRRDERRLKKREIALSRQAAFIVIQDAERASVLAEENCLPLDRFVLVPNAPFGPAQRKRSRYWHRRFGLPPWSRVVLHAGSIAPWTGIDELAGSVDGWPEGWVLVIHSRREIKEPGRLGYIERVAASGRVFLSLEPVPRHEFDDLVNGADVGIAFYVPTGGSRYTQKNIEMMGLSSGKLAYYLRAGLPVIVNRASSVARFVEEQGCGLSVDSASNVGEALVLLTERYEEFSRGACHAFDQHLDYAKAFRAVLDRMKSLGGR